MMSLTNCLFWRSAPLLMEALRRRQALEENKAKEQKEDLVASGEMVKDPVCGAYVSRARGHSRAAGRVVLHFARMNAVKNI
jgi:hypothetical protein